MRQRIQTPFRCILVLPMLSLCIAAGATSIERVEPPSWWQGFAVTTLQLMIHGDDVATLRAQVDEPGIAVRRTVTTDNPDYLFVYLDIGSRVQPGEFDIVLSNEHVRLTHRYRLDRKNPDPAHARGFGPEDAIYLITPDRFANGDPGNDNVRDMGDRVDRRNPGGRHGGDIAGIVEHLDYIGDMGFTAIWLNPLLENRMPSYSYHGYATTDFYRVDPRYGSNEDYRALVGKARAMGIGVIMDMIVNHIGSNHWWMSDLPASNWINHAGEFVPTTHERTVWQDPYAVPGDIAGFADGWFVESMPDLNQRNPLLEDYLIQNALWWIEYLGLAGIRMDTYPYPDKHFMSRWSERVMLEYPAFNVVGEEWSLNPAIVSYWQRGKVNHDGYVSYLPSLMDFPLQHALTEALTSADETHGSGLVTLYRALANDFLYADPRALVVFGDNHDMSRLYTQLGEDDGLYRMAMTYLLTMRGIPQIYYGTEILMSNPGTEAHGVIRSDFPGGWAGDTADARSGRGLTARQRAARDFVRTLLAWRRDQGVVHRGELAHFYPVDGIYVWFRYDDRDRVMAVINKNRRPVELELARFGAFLPPDRTALDVIAGESRVLRETLSVPPRDVLLLDFE